MHRVQVVYSDKYRHNLKTHKAAQSSQDPEAAVLTEIVPDDPERQDHDQNKLETPQTNEFSDIKRRTGNFCQKSYQR